MISYDGVYFGYAPNYDPQVTMADLTAATGQKGATWVNLPNQRKLTILTDCDIATTSTPSLPRPTSTAAPMMAMTSTMWRTSSLPELFLLLPWWPPLTGQMLARDCVSLWLPTLKVPLPARGLLSGCDLPMKWTTMPTPALILVEVSWSNYLSLRLVKRLVGC